MKNKLEYNGWTNYETWAAALWLEECDMGSSDYWREQLEDRDDKTVCALAEQLRTIFQKGMPVISGVYRDLLTAAMSKVDWDEIAKAILASIPTRSQWDHEDLHRSKRGRYWIESWSQYQGSVPVAQYVSAQDAARWLLLCEHELPADLVFIADELSE